MMYTIAIGCDHGGFQLKSAVIAHLENKGYLLKDFGTFSEDSCDYPDIAEAVAEAVADGQFERGILICEIGRAHV